VVYRVVEVGFVHVANSPVDLVREWWQVELHEFSVHADRAGRLAFLEHYRESELLLNHGDRCGAFAEVLRADGYDARVPELGETLTF
jgi:Cft2 family RNA processing exonuclease